MMVNPAEIKEFVIDGVGLTMEELVAAARFGAKVSIAPKAVEAMAASRALVEKIVEEKRTAYGVNTGFGDFSKVAIPEIGRASCRERVCEYV